MRLSTDLNLNLLGLSDLIQARSHGNVVEPPPIDPRITQEGFILNFGLKNWSLDIILIRNETEKSWKIALHPCLKTQLQIKIKSQRRSKKSNQVWQWSKLDLEHKSIVLL